MAGCLDLVDLVWLSLAVSPPQRAGELWAIGQTAIIWFLEESQAELYCCFYTKPRRRLFSPLFCFLVSVLDWIDPGEGKKIGFAVLTSFQRESAVWEPCVPILTQVPPADGDGALLVAWLGLQMCQGQIAMATGALSVWGKVCSRWWEGGVCWCCRESQPCIGIHLL